MKIAVIGDYDPNRPSHIATSEALREMAVYFPGGMLFEWIPTQSLETQKNLILLTEFDGI